MNSLPLIVDVKRHSLEDGPGIRSVVFFKGCPLRCIFCQNPEAQDTGGEIAFSATECIQCGRCADACPQGAIDLGFTGRIHRDRCDSCGICVKVCPGKGLRLIGAYYPVGTLAELLLRDIAFYRHSGGGVTLSGGECTLYPDYVESLLKALKSKTVHIVLETSGYFEYDEFKRKILPYTDLIYYDIKIADPWTHHKYVGRTNHRILENFCRLLQEENIEVHPRIPLVPGITATRKNLSSIVDFLCKAGAESVSVLPYNPMGIQMAVSLGKPRPSIPDRFMKSDEEKEISDMLRTIISSPNPPPLRGRGGWGVT